MPRGIINRSATAQAVIRPTITDAIYFGVDQSMSGTGIVAQDCDGGFIDATCITTNPSSNPMDEIQRFHKILNALIGFIEKHRGENSACICMEDFAYSQTNNMAMLGGLGWFLRIMFVQAGYHLSVASIAAIKKVATGKGQGNKSAVVLGVYKRWGYETDNDNIADAYTLSYISRIAYTNPIPGTKGVLVRDLEILDKVKTYC